MRPFIVHFSTTSYYFIPLPPNVAEENKLGLLSFKIPNVIHTLPHPFDSWWQ
jgi:hypothetical protein